MDSNKVASELVEIAKELTAGNKIAGKLIKRLHFGSRFSLKIRESIIGYDADSVKKASKRCLGELKNDISKLTESYSIVDVGSVVLAGRYVYIEAIATSELSSKQMLKKDDYLTITKVLKYKD